MYSIYAEINGHSVCIHDDTVANPSLKVVEPVLTMEDSAAGSLTFQLAPNNLGYNEYTYEEEIAVGISPDGEVTTRKISRTVDLVARMKSTVTVFQNGTEIWEGRVLTEERDFYNLRSIYCEGALSYLNDTCQPYRRYSGIDIREFVDVVLKLHNSRVDSAHQFRVGIVDVHDDSDYVTFETKYEKTLETINSLVKTYGGHIRIRKVNGVRYLDYLKDYTTISTQTITFGKNLLDFTCKWDMSKLCTVLMPIGKVVQRANTNKIGDEVTPYSGPVWGQLQYKDTENQEIRVKQDSSLGGYCVAIYNVTPEKNYYVSCRLHGGFVAYCLKMGANGTGMTHSYKQAGSDSSIGFTDFVDQKLEIPAGVHSVVVCGWGSDIPVSLKDETEETTGMDQYLTIEDVDTDGDWHSKGSAYVVNQSMVTEYGWIENQLSLSDIEDADKLYTMAKDYLQNGQFDEMCIEISAVDLTVLGVNVSALKLYEKVRVTSPPHGLDRLFPISKLEIPLNNPSEQQYMLGVQTDQGISEVTSTASGINDDLLSEVSAMPSRILISAQQNAANMIASATHGYVAMVDKDDDGIPDEIVIANAPIETPNLITSCWIWNTEGLGHSDHYPLRTGESLMNVALTSDGSIVADRITTGILRSITIRGCNIFAGGMDQHPGRIVAVSSDPSNVTCASELRNGGIYFGDVDQNGNLTPYSRIRDDGTIYQDYDTGQDIGRGLAVTAKVFAINADQIWVSSAADPGDDARAGTDVEVRVPKSTDVDIKLTFRHGILIDKEEIDPFDLLTYEPPNWSSTYTNYYTKDQNDNYHKVPEQTPPPSWAANTYYERT